jgi:membrane protein implicated in regulation of membrane protease activity
VFVVWIVAAVVLAIGEVLTPGLFFLGPVAVAAALAAIVALVAGAVPSTIVFIVAGLLSLAVLRPIARRHVRMPQLLRTGTDALVGRKAVVTRRVDATAGGCASAAKSGRRARTSTTGCTPKARRSTSSGSKVRPHWSPDRRFTWLG